MAGEAGREATFLRGPVATTPLTRRGGDVASRVADNLYWLGRYIERADAMVRILREILRYLLENQPAVRGASATPDILLEALSHLTTNYPCFLTPEAREAPEAELLDLIYNHERPGGLAFNLGQALSAGRRVRDRLSEDNWRILNTMQDRFLHRKEPGRTLRALENLAILLAAFAGVCNETMNHGQGWRFLEIGRRVERAISTFSILRTVFASHVVRDELLLETVLYLKDSLRVYHRRYQARAIEPEAALDILLLDEGHPQSAGYQIARLNELAADLPESSRGARRGSGRSREERLIIEAQSLLRLTEMDSLRETSELDQLLQRLNFTLCAFSDALTSHYLTPGELPRQVQV
jgi:uncharacterized alpha-E superfamily protein